MVILYHPHATVKDVEKEGWVACPGSQSQCSWGSDIPVVIGGQWPDFYAWIVTLLFWASVYFFFSITRFVPIQHYTLSAHSGLFGAPSLGPCGKWIGFKFHSTHPWWLQTLRHQFPNFNIHQGQQEGWKPTLRASDSVSLRWGLRICISSKVP